MAPLACACAGVASGKRGCKGVPPSVSTSMSVSPSVAPPLGRPRSAAATLMVATCLERRVVGVRPEALEARSNEALSRLFARTTRFKRASDSRTALCIRMRPYGEADTVVSDGAPGCIGCTAITA